MRTRYSLPIYVNWKEKFCCGTVEVNKYPLAARENRSSGFSRLSYKTFHPGSRKIPTDYGTWFESVFRNTNSYAITFWGNFLVSQQELARKNNLKHSVKHERINYVEGGAIEVRILVFPMQLDWQNIAGQMEPYGEVLSITCDRYKTCIMWCVLWIYAYWSQCQDM